GRRRARGEPDGHLAADRRGSGDGPARRAHGARARRPPAGSRAPRSAGGGAARGRRRDGLGGRAGRRRLGTDRALVTTILLLHGWPVSERMWVPQVSALRDAGHDVWAPHLYG